MAGFRDLSVLLCQHSVCSRGALGNCSDLCLLVRILCVVQQLANKDFHLYPLEIHQIAAPRREFRMGTVSMEEM